MVPNFMHIVGGILTFRSGSIVPAGTLGARMVQRRSLVVSLRSHAKRLATTENVSVVDHADICSGPPGHFKDTAAEIFNSENDNARFTTAIRRSYTDQTHGKKKPANCLTGFSFALQRSQREAIQQFLHEFLFVYWGLPSAILGTLFMLAGVSQNVAMPVAGIFGPIVAMFI